MKKYLLSFAILPAMFLLFFAPASYAADALYHFMHNGHDSLILGQVSAVEDGLCTITVSETIVSPFTVNHTTPVRLLQPQTVKINAANILYFGHENRPPLLNDNVLISVNQAAEDMFEIANGAYLVDSLDKSQLSVILAEDAPASCLPVAAAVECFMLSGAQISTYLFYQDTAVAYYMGADHNYSNSLYIYYQGYEEATPRTPVPSSQLPQPRVEPTFEFSTCATVVDSAPAPTSAQPTMVQPPSAAPGHPYILPVLYMGMAMSLLLAITFIRQGRLKQQ